VITAYVLIQTEVGKAGQVAGSATENLCEYLGVAGYQVKSRSQTKA
jgi:hypothetical protein